MDRRESPLDFRDKNYTSLPTPQYRSPEAIMHDIRKRVREVAVYQERLARSRNVLLLKREHIRALVKNVQVARVKAGDAEAAFMSYVRIVATEGLRNDRKQERQVIFTDLYNRVESTRNELGVLETDLQQNGRALTGAEVRFMEEENAFYQYDLVEMFEEDFNLLEDNEATVAYVPTISMVPPPQPPPPPPPPLPPQSYSTYTYLLHNTSNGQDNLPRPSLPPPPVSSFEEPLPLRPSRVTPFSHLPPAPLPLSVTTTPKAICEAHNDQYSILELDGLGKQFDHSYPVETPSRNRSQVISEQLNHRASPEPKTSLSVDASTRSHFRVLSSGGSIYVESEQSQGQDASAEQFVDLEGRQRFSPGDNESKKSVLSQNVNQPLDEKPIPEFHSKLTIKHRIRVWLFNLLQQSKIEKALYQNILEDTLKRYGFQYPDNESWEAPATQYWSQDSRSSFEADLRGMSNTSSCSSADARSTSGIEIFAGRLPQRHSARTYPARNIDDPSNFHLNTVEFSADESDDPSYYPLPRSPSLALSNAEGADKETHDPYYFTLPLSPNTTEHEVTEARADNLGVVSVTPAPTGLAYELEVVNHGSKFNCDVLPKKPLSPPRLSLARSNEDELATLFQSISEPTTHIPARIKRSTTPWYRWRLETRFTPPTTLLQDSWNLRQVCDLISRPKSFRSLSTSAISHARKTRLELKRTLSKDKVHA